MSARDARPTRKPMTVAERQLLEAIRELLDMPVPDWDDRWAHRDAVCERIALLNGCIDAATAPDSYSTLSTVTKTVREFGERPLGYRPWAGHVDRHLVNDK